MRIYVKFWIFIIWPYIDNDNIVYIALKKKKFSDILVRCITIVRKKKYLIGRKIK